MASAGFALAGIIDAFIPLLLLGMVIAAIAAIQVIDGFVPLPRPRCGRVAA